MPENARAIFVSNLKSLMAAKGVEQVDMVAALGLTASTISDWVTGKKYPRIDRMQMLADYFDVPMSVLTIQQTSQDLHPATVVPFGPNDEDPARMVTTEEEYDLLKAYRGAEETARRYALEMLRAHQLNLCE